MSLRGNNEEKKMWFFSGGSGLSRNNGHLYLTVLDQFYDESNAVW